VGTSTVLRHPKRCERKPEKLGAVKKEPAQESTRRNVVRDEGKAHPSTGQSAATRKPPNKTRGVPKVKPEGQKKGYASPKSKRSANFRESRDPDPGWTVVSKKRPDRELAQLRLLVKNQAKIIAELTRKVDKLAPPKSRTPTKSLPSAGAPFEECTARQPRESLTIGFEKLNRTAVHTRSGKKRITPSGSGTPGTSVPVAGPTKPIGQQTAITPCHQDTQLPSMAYTVSDAKDSSPVLNRPKTGGTSVAANKLELTPQVEVAYAKNKVFISRRRLPHAVRRKLRSAEALPTDLDLHYYLVLEFAMVPRSQEIMRQMVLKAKNYLQKFDLLSHTNEGVYKLIMSCVRSAMAIPPEEESLRASLKQPEVREGMLKHAKLINTGDAGSTWMFKKHLLPKSK